jgi:hypothetical protein
LPRNENSASPSRSGSIVAGSALAKETLPVVDEYAKIRLSGTQCREPGGQTMISAAQCRSARTLLRWSVSKLASAASVTESAIDDFELERRQPDTTDSIQRAFENAGVVFLPQDDVQLRGVTSAVT